MFSKFGFKLFRTLSHISFPNILVAAIECIMFLGLPLSGPVPGASLTHNRGKKKNNKKKTFSGSRKATVFGCICNIGGNTNGHE